MADEVKICEIQGLELILNSINCEKYKSKFENYGINEYTFAQLTVDDLKDLNVDNEDINTILTAINVLNKTLNRGEVRLSNDEILKLQSAIHGQLGYIALILNQIYCSINSDNIHLNDMLIDNHISAIDAAFMLKPYMRAEEKNIENTLKNVFKITTRRKTIMITTTMCIVLVFGLTFQRLNYSFNFNSVFKNL
ncbi:uncharacterized protein LOC112593681, partial [Melanaphis sacchari]|uniref:uncharacterized protein LOC112593681 n=1 Tax=Melanaphis sacchari TaxID=742174 RepID=UPI000DC148F9